MKPIVNTFWKILNFLTFIFLSIAFWKKILYKELKIIKFCNIFVIFDSFPQLFLEFSTIFSKLSTIILTICVIFWYYYEQEKIGDFQKRLTKKFVRKKLSIYYKIITKLSTPVDNFVDNFFTFILKGCLKCKLTKTNF